MIPLFLWLVACSTEPPSQAVSPEPATNEISLEDRIKAIERTLKLQSEAASKEKLKALQQKVAGLEDRLTSAEQLLRELRNEGIIKSELVIFDPRTTTLEGTNVQTILEQIASKVSKLEHAVYDDRGDAGPGLFKLPKGKGKPGGHGGPGGPGGPNGGPDPGQQGGQHHQGPQQGSGRN